MDEIKNGCPTANHLDSASDLRVTQQELRNEELTVEHSRQAALLLHTQGYVVLRQALPMDTFRQAAEEFQWILRDCFASKAGDAWYQRGKESDAIFWERNLRWRIFPKLRSAFASRWILANPLVMPILRRLLDDGMFCKFVSSDTCVAGCEQQAPHRELGVGVRWEPSAYVVNIPLCRCDMKNGPLEVWPGIGHLWNNQLLDQLQLESDVQDGQNRDGDWLSRIFPSCKLNLEPGDIVIRDPGLLHRGNVNQTDVPRTMLTTCYFRQGHWHDYGDLDFNLDRQLWQQLDTDVQPLFEHHFAIENELSPR